MLKNKIILIGTYPRSLINFRGELIRKFVLKGYKVTTIGCNANDDDIRAIQSLGVDYINLPFENSSLNPLDDIKMIINYYFIFKKLQPDYVLSYTIKPIIWGGLAARLTGSNFFALITGFGFAFHGKSFKRKALTKIVSVLYKFSLSYATRVIFQNKDNRKVFVDKKIVSLVKTEIVNGSGVDVNHFFYHSPPPIKKQALVFLCIARLLNEKGLREFEQASEIMRKKYPNTICQIAGFYDSSPDRISSEEVNRWQKKGTIVYLGTFKDVRTLISASHIYVLPSYHEGLPRSTLEAMAMGRPVITTLAVGCRETVEDGNNGFKVPVGNAKKLAKKMIWFIENPEQIMKMGLVSRKMAEERFDVHKVNKKILKIMEIK